MRLVTFEVGAGLRLGAEHRGRIVDLQNAYCLREMFYAGAAAVERARAELPSDILSVLGDEAAGRAARETLAFIDQMPAAILEALDAQGSVIYRPEQVRLLPPVPKPPKIICLGLNYRDHAAESGQPVPTEPIVFSKYASSLIGPGATIALPPTSAEVDYEAELVFVIGRSGRHVPESEAMRYVAGYTCGNDVSARDYQLKKPGGQWMVGKTFDTFAPTGPVLVTADEVRDPHDLPIRCVLNGETMQDSNTSQLVFGIPQLVAYLSHVFTLEVGDLVFTGTPPGVGFARRPPVFLKADDMVEIEIDGIGTLRNSVRGA
jgi:2-keto-4-pentenoate hydratase/2-oxohepta-3-ene-1,7-dioic acid hydratase in catechol pathway